MAPTTSPGRNLLLTLPPELRNEIYALVITTDFYELHPTISAKTFPRPRYNIFGIQRGIKAQGGTPAIAKTCREIRTEALNVYYGSNTFALIGDDATRAKDKVAIANRIAAHEWVKLIGDDAKYLRKVRVLLNTGPQVLVHCLMSIASNPTGGAPIVKNQSHRVGPISPISFQFAPRISESLEGSIQKHLLETNDMGMLWRAIVERALYFADIDSSGCFTFDISGEGIAKASAKYPLKKSKSSAKKSAKKSLSSTAYQASPRELQTPKEAVQPHYDSDCMVIEAPAKKAKIPTTQAKALQDASWSSRKTQPVNDQDTDFDVIEVEAPTHRPKTRKKARRTTPEIEVVQ